MPTLSEASEGFVKLRNRKKEIQGRHKEELAPLNDQMKKLEAYLLQTMNQQGITGCGTETHTVYQNNRSSVKIEEWGPFLQWILENEAWDFLAKRAADAPVKQYLEEHGHLPPGLSISTEQILGVRAK